MELLDIAYKLTPIAVVLLTLLVGYMRLRMNADFVPRADHAATSAAIEERLADVEHGQADRVGREALAGLTQALGELAGEQKAQKVEIAGLHQRIEDTLPGIKISVARIEDFLLKKQA